jgi:hypothetical protein
MSLILAAGGGIFAPSLIAILLFVGAFAALNVIEKGRWD